MEVGLSQSRKDLVENTDEWIDGFCSFNKMGWLTKVRFYFRNKLFHNFVDDKNSRILDVGCGTAIYISNLKKLGYLNVYGVEPDINLFQQNHRGYVSLGNSCNLPFTVGTFDCIYIFGILHHLRNTEEYRQTMEEVDRCLRPGGVIIIIEPSSRFFFTILNILTRCLSPFFRQAAVIYRLLDEEKEQLYYFFRNGSVVTSILQSKKYEVLKDQKLFHQWALVMRKPLSNV